MQPLNSQTRFTSTDYVFFLVVAILFYLLNRFTPFPILDDAVYQYINGMICNPERSYEPVSSIKDAFISQIQDYQTANGRFIVHFIVQCFCGVWGIEIFRVANTLVFVLFCAGLIKLIRFHFGLQPTDKYLIIFSLFCLLPISGSLLWGAIAYAVNYLWPSCAIVWLLYLYVNLQTKQDSSPLILKICICLAAFIVGALQESFSIGISGALFLYYCFHLKELKGNIAWLVIGFWIGSCFLIFAPSNFLRVETTSNFNILGYLSRFAHSIFDLKIFFLLLLILCICYVKSKHICIRFIQQHSLWFTAMLINILFAGLVAYTEKRQMTSVELFSFILALMLLYTFFLDKVARYQNVISIIAITCVIILYIPVYLLKKEDYIQQMKALQEIKSFDGRTFVAETYLNYYIKNHNKYLYANYTQSTYTYINHYWNHYWRSILISNGKNPNQLVFLPKTTEYIAKHCTQETCLQKNVYQFPLEAGFYITIIRLPEEINLNNLNISCWAEPVNWIGKIRKKLFYTQLLNRFEIDETRNYVRDGFRYCVVSYPFPVKKVDFKQK